MENTFSILVWLNKSKLNNKKAPVYGRVTVNGKRSEISLKINIEPEKWDSKKSYVKGNKEEARIFNTSIDNFLLKVRRIYENIIQSGNIVTSENIKHQYSGNTFDNYTILRIFTEHVEELTKRVGKDYTFNTVRRYKATYNCLKEFIKHVYKTNDVNLKDLNYNFISKFESYLRIEKNNKQNTICKNIQQLKTITGMALKRGLIEKELFYKYNVKSEQGKRGYLTIEELEKFEKTEISDKKLQLVRDLFIFSCYTGIAYIDIYNLTNNDITIGIDGEKWIISDRQKSASKFMIPLLDNNSSLNLFLI